MLTNFVCTFTCYFAVQLWDVFSLCVCTQMSLSQHITPWGWFICALGYFACFPPKRMLVWCDDPGVPPSDSTIPLSHITDQDTECDYFGPICHSHLDCRKPSASQLYSVCPGRIPLHYLPLLTPTFFSLFFLLRNLSSLRRRQENRSRPFVDVLAAACRSSLAII